MDSGASSPEAAVRDATAARRPVAPELAPRSAVAMAAGRNGFFPGLLIALALVGWLSFQAVQQYAERQQLAALQGGIDVQEVASKKLRTSLDAVATSTAKLADAGNANARLVVEELRKRGITINSNGATKPP